MLAGLIGKVSAESLDAIVMNQSEERPTNPGLIAVRVIHPLSIIGEPLNSTGISRLRAAICSAI
jgi:hypothetical protein